MLTICSFEGEKTRNFYYYYYYYFVDKNRLAYIGLRDIDAEEVIYESSIMTTNTTAFHIVRWEERWLGTAFRLLCCWREKSIFETSTQRRWYINNHKQDYENEWMFIGRRDDQDQFFFFFFGCRLHWSSGHRRGGGVTLIIFIINRNTNA